MATIEDRLDGLNIMVGKKLRKIDETSEKHANKTGTLSGHSTSDAQTKFPNVSAVNEGLNGKVDKVTGRGLSEENFSTLLKDKLAGLESSKFRGKFIGADTSSLPTSGNVDGSYADLDTSTAGDTVKRFIWDLNDAEWVEQIGASTELTASEIKQLYESNSNTFAFTQEFIDKINDNESDVSTLLNELTTYYKPLGEEFPNWASELNAATPNIVVS